MQNRAFWPTLAFVLALCLHNGWSMFHAAAPCAGGACPPGSAACAPSAQAGPGLLSGLVAYRQRGDVWLGLSYALAAAFTAYALSHWAANRRGAATGALAGLTLGSALAIFGCFLVGCCGSPMLPVWIALLGGKALGLTKPLMAGLTLVSVLVGYFLLNRGCRAGCGCGSEGCDEADAPTPAAEAGPPPTPSE